MHVPIGMCIPTDELKRAKGNYILNIYPILFIILNKMCYNSSMEKVVHTIINYLNIGTSPTIISFPDDGLIHIFDILNTMEQIPQNYDPHYAFIYISTQYLKNTDIEVLENQINTELTQQREKGIIETLQAGYDIAVVIDDIEICDDSYNIVFATDGILKKYKNKIKFIYLIETPNIQDYFPNGLPPTTSIFDATIYFKIGMWDLKTLIKYAVNTKGDLPIKEEEILNIEKVSHRHFGIFKRLYRDMLMNSDHINDYIEYLLKNFSLEEISAFKKKLHKLKLSITEQAVEEMYAKVGLIENGEITVPIIREKLEKYRVKTEFKNDKDKLANINYDLFTKSEKDIMEHMKNNEEVTKEEIARIIWGSEANEKYSEWAIEQRMSRLRKKIRQLGYNIDIETLYNKGYKLILN